MILTRASVAISLLISFTAFGQVQRPLQGERAETVLSLTANRIGAINALFKEMDKTDVPGCAVGVVQKGRLVFGRGYGMANLEHGIPLDTRSIFRMGSVGKQFTAGVVAQLALDRQVALDADIRTYLPELPDFGEPVTVRQLLHHTSGYRDYFTLMDLRGSRWEEDYFDDPEIYRLLTLQQELNFEPGEQFMYSNTGYFLLSQLVLRVTGKSLAEVAEERIFGPLGMGSAHYHDHWRRIVPGRATGYSQAELYRLEGGKSRIYHGTWPGYVPGAWASGRDPFNGAQWVVNVTTLPMIGDGGVFSSVEDMVPWVSHLIKGGSAWHDLMLSRGVLDSGEILPYGFGLEHGEQGGLRTIGHSGAFVGFNAGVQTWPEAGTGVIVLCNRSDVDAMGLAEEVGAVGLANRMKNVDKENAPAQGPELKSETAAMDVFLKQGQQRIFLGKYYSPELEVVWELLEVNGALRLRIGNRDAGVLRAREPNLLELEGGMTVEKLPLSLRFEGSSGAHTPSFLVDADRVRNLRFERVDNNKLK